MFMWPLVGSMTLQSISNKAESTVRLLQSYNVCKGCLKLLDYASNSHQLVSLNHDISHSLILTTGLYW